MITISIVYTGRTYQRAAELPTELELADDATVQDALDRLAEHLPADQPLPASCLVAVSGEHVGTVADRPTRRLAQGDELVIVAPVAGG